MELGLRGATAYVSGAAGGIGRAIVELFATEGVEVFAVDIDVEATEAYVRESGLPGVRAFGADLSTSTGCVDAVQTAVAHFGAPPTILVNNVGIGQMLPFEELSDEDFHRTFELNFFSVMRTCRQLLPMMRDAGGGSVVNVTSDLGGQPETVFVDYQASKAAVVNLSKALARTYAPTIRINDVAPGPIRTPLWFRPGGFLEVVEKNYGLVGDEALSALVEDRGIPMGRLGDPSEVAAAVAFLASPMAGFTTGTSLGVNGGTLRSAF